MTTSLGERLRPLWPWMWAVLGIALLVRAATRPENEGVILDHLEFGRRVLHGEELYAPFGRVPALHAPYPPTLALLTIPFSFLPLSVARVAWCAMELFALFVIGKRSRASHAALFVTALVAARFILRDTHGGGFNLVNVALIVEAWHQASAGRGVRAALALGVSLAIKPNMLLFVPLFGVFGHLRMALGSLLVGAGCAALVALRTGVAPFLRWLEGTWRYATQQDLFATPALDFPPFAWMNQSLRCLVERVCRETPDALASEVPHFVQGIGLGAPATSAIRVALAALLLGITFGVAWRRRAEPTARLPLIAATFALSFLLSPISWKAHAVALAPALLFCVQERRVVFLALFLLACGLGEEIVFKSGKMLQQSCYLVTLGALALWMLSLRRAAR